MPGQCVVHGATLRGVEAVPVEVEVVVGNGMPGMFIVGMPDAAIQESRERVRAAIRASGFSMPNERVVVNLAPGSLRKTGSGFDLPIAVGILIATGQVDPLHARGRLLVGELSLEGAVRPVSGILAYALCARDAGYDVVCGQPHSGFVRVEGVEQLSGAQVKAMDLRAGVALVQAALTAKGTSEIEDIYWVERGYEDLVGKLQGLGADIHKVVVPDAAFAQNA